MPGAPWVSSALLGSVSSGVTPVASAAASPPASRYTRAPTTVTPTHAQVSSVQGACGVTRRCVGVWIPAPVSRAKLTRDATWACASCERVGTMAAPADSFVAATHVCPIPAPTWPVVMILFVAKAHVCPPADVRRVVQASGAPTESASTTLVVVGVFVARHVITPTASATRIPALGWPVRWAWCVKRAAA